MVTCGMWPVCCSNYSHKEMRTRYKHLFANKPILHFYRLTCTLSFPFNMTLFGRVFSMALLFSERLFMQYICKSGFIGFKKLGIWYVINSG